MAIAEMATWRQQETQTLRMTVPFVTRVNEEVAAEYFGPEPIFRRLEG